MCISIKKKEVVLTIHFYFNIFNINIFYFFRKNIEKSCDDEKNNL